MQPKRARIDSTKEAAESTEKSNLNGSHDSGADKQTTDAQDQASTDLKPRNVPGALNHETNSANMLIDEKDHKSAHTGDTSIAEAGEQEAELAMKNQLTEVCIDLCLSFSSLW